MKKIILVALIFLTGLALTGEDLQYFLNIPDVPGDVREPGFQGWIRCTAVQYRLPGVPSPTTLPRKPPTKKRGLLTAEEVDKPFASISKPLDKTDSSLYKACNDKLPFLQWKLALCSPSGEIYMAFIFKDVVISAIKKRDNKQYITFKYEKVIWNYTGIKR